MINQKTKFYVGLFMVGGISLAVVAIIWLGMSRFLEQGQFYAVYFDESVQGLKPDSPVKYRGVAVGNIERIGMAPDSRLIEVVLKIEADITLDENMVAQQKAVGITGSKFIELDRKKNDIEIISPKLTFPTEYRVLASRPSNISELFHSVDDIVNKLNTFDIVGISDGLKVTLEHLDQSLQDFDAKGVSGDIRTSLAGINKNFDPERWDKIITGLEENMVSLGEVVGNTNDLFTNATALLARTETEVANLGRYILVVGQYLEKASGNLDQILEQVSDQPSQLLFSEPPVEKEFEENVR